MLIVIALSGSSNATWREEFESLEPTWRLADADCRASVTHQQRMFSGALRGNGCEWLRLTSGQGTYAYLTHQVRPARVIPELRVSLWVKSDRRDLWLAARVIFPRSIDARTGRPFSRLIRGPTYDRPGEWQQLRIEDASLLLSREARLMRAQFDQEIDEREAYIDLVVLNAYGGPGATQIWMDELELEGDVPPVSAEARAETGASRTAAEGESAALSRVSGSILTAEGRPLLARMIEHRGEPLEFLKGLGFNVVWLARPPTGQQLAEARRLDLWIVAPPPDEFGLVDGSRPEDRILAWNLGESLAPAEVERVRALAGELRRGGRPVRPLLCGAEADLWSYSRIADVLLLSRDVLGTSFELADFRQWLRQRQRLGRDGRATWAAIATEPHEAVQRQWLAFGEDLPTTVSVDPQAIRLSAWSAIAAGARGILFRSKTRLDDGTPAAELRRLTLQLVNRELLVLEPWAAAGTPLEEAATTDSQVRASLLQTERSQLLVLIREAPSEQYVLGAPPRGAVSVTVDAPAASMAWHVTPTGLEPPLARRAAGGIRLTLDDVGTLELVLLSQDRLAITHLTRHLAEAAQETTHLKYQTAAASLREVEEIDLRLASLGKSLPETAQRMQQAKSAELQARQLFAARDWRGADRVLGDAQRAIAAIRRAHWEQAVAGFPQPVSSPYCVFFETLPMHWRLADRLGRAQWSSDLLLGGNMESLDSMLAAGWRRNRTEINGVQSAVELSPLAAKSGEAALRLRAFAGDPAAAPAVVESSPVWMNSPPIAVRAGQIVRIHGWVKLPAPIEGSLDGLLISDSLGGMPLAQRIRTAGDWQPFTLYRAAPASGELVVTFSLTGLGEAWIDDVTVSLADESGQAAAR